MSLNLTNYSLKSSLAIALVGLGLAASAVHAQPRLSTADLLKYVNEVEACGADRTVVSARYESATSDKIVVTCRDVTGLWRGIGTWGALGAMTLGAMGTGSGSSTTSTY